MTHRQYFIIAGLVAFMALSAYGLGQWSVSLNPDGIVPHTPTTESAAEASVAPRSAFTFAASMGLLAVGLVYAMLAAVLILRAKARGLPVARFDYCIAALAAAGFALSYLIDDYFY